MRQVNDCVVYHSPLQISRILLNSSLLILTSLLSMNAVADQNSQLWGTSGEAWTPGGRLPDFSFAGYHFGEDPLPVANVACSVKDFGAVGDGEHDDTQAFKDAIAATERGAVFVPPGRYKITDIIWIEKPNLVLRGAGPQESILYCPKPLEEIKPNMGATTGGRPTSNYSWSGGIVWIKGQYEMVELATVTAPAKRGDQWIEVSATDQIQPGEVVLIAIEDDEDRTLIDYLYSDDPGDTVKLKPAKADMRSRIVSKEGQRIQLERPLSFDLRPEWKPTVKLLGATVYESGVEDIGFDFPNTPYEGHFTELGYNAIAINRAVDCWARNIWINNCDSGIYLRGHNCTVDGVVIESERPTDKGGQTGHHGLDAGQDCLITDFDIRTEFIHDITVDNYAAGNVIKNGRGNDLRFDHHKKAPYQNLFTNIDAGKGTNIWHCGGGAALGKHSGARGTFWGITAQKNINPPNEGFGPQSLNFVGLTTNTASTFEIDGVWWENIPPAELSPNDLHAAQLERRLQARDAQ